MSGFSMWVWVWVCMSTSLNTEYVQYKHAYLHVPADGFYLRHMFFFSFILSFEKPNKQQACDTGFEQKELCWVGGVYVCMCVLMYAEVLCCGVCVCVCVCVCVWI